MLTYFIVMENLISSNCNNMFNHEVAKVIVHCKTQTTKGLFGLCVSANLSHKHGGSFTLPFCWWTSSRGAANTNSYWFGLNRLRIETEITVSVEDASSTPWSVKWLQNVIQMMINSNSAPSAIRSSCTSLLSMPTNGDIFRTKDLLLLVQALLTFPFSKILVAHARSF